MSEASNVKAMELYNELLDLLPDGFSLGIKRDGHWNRATVLAPLYDLMAHIEIDMEGRIGVRGFERFLETKVFDSPGEAAEHILRCCSR